MQVEEMDFLTKIDTAVGEQAIIYTPETIWRAFGRSIERVSRERQRPEANSTTGRFGDTPRGTCYFIVLS